MDEARKQMKDIIDYVISVEMPSGDEGKKYPVNWDYINNVLSCDKVLGKARLWLYYGKIMIHNDNRVKRAGSMKVLKHWMANPDGTIKLVGVDYDNA